MTKLLNPISTKNLIYLTIFFSPAYLLRFSIFDIPLNALDILIVLTLFLWIYENNFNLFKKIKYSLKKISSFILPISLILIGLLISTFLNDNFLKELGIVKSWFILPIIFGIIVYIETKNSTDFEKILNSLLFSSFSISVISIFYLVFDNLTYDNRLSAFYSSPNHLAMTLVPGILISLANIIQNKQSRYFKLVLIIPILISLFFTHSYSAWIALFISSLIIIFFSSGKKTILFIFITTIFFIFFFEHNSDKLKSLNNSSANSSLSSRIAIWKSAEKIIYDNWLWGIGPGNFQEKYLSYQKYFYPYPEWAVPQPHNIFLAFWLQAGFFGLFGFVYLIILWFLKIKKILIYFKDFTNRRPFLIILSILFYIILHGLTDTTYWKNDLSLIFWLIIFLGLSLSSQEIKLDSNSK
ncbi:MAG: O-antigen ligase family protein [Parcubacteria group bacterium]|jgi:O-antigen ligase